MDSWRGRAIRTEENLEATEFLPKFEDNEVAHLLSNLFQSSNNNVVDLMVMFFWNKICCILFHFLFFLLDCRLLVHLNRQHPKSADFFFDFFASKCVKVCEWHLSTSIDRWRLQLDTGQPCNGEHVFDVSCFHDFVVNSVQLCLFSIASSFLLSARSIKVQFVFFSWVDHVFEI